MKNTNIYANEDLNVSKESQPESYVLTKLDAIIAVKADEVRDIRSIKNRLRDMEIKLSGHQLHIEKQVDEKPKAPTGFVDTYDDMCTVMDYDIQSIISILDRLAIVV